MVISMGAPNRFQKRHRRTNVPKATLADTVAMLERMKTGDGGVKVWPPTRIYLPTFAELVDRLTVVQMKAIFIPEKRDEYIKEIGLILHDLDAVLNDKFQIEDYRIDAKGIRAIIMIMLSNRCIWESESKARAGGSDQDMLLKFTHSINGVRNTAKNVLAVQAGERLDHKTDALSSDLLPEFGNWRVFE